MRISQPIIMKQMLERGTFLKRHIYAYIRSYAYYSVTITLADSLFFDADILLWSCIFGAY